jgi:type III secretion system low calcium response chaperone LcrH/SycD
MATEITAKQEMEELIKQAVDQLGPEYSDQLKASLADAARKIYFEGMLPKDAMGISDAVMDGIYRIACELYEGGKFDEARKIFAFLRFLDGSKFRFVFAQALCYHRQEDYANAAACYAISALINQEDPWPLLRIAECHLSLDLPDLAYEVLSDAINRAGNNPEYEQIKNRALLMQGKIKQGLTTREAPKKKKKKKKIKKTLTKKEDK